MCLVMCDSPLVFLVTVLVVEMPAMLLSAADHLGHILLEDCSEGLLNLVATFWKGLG